MVCVADDINNLKQVWINNELIAENNDWQGTACIGNHAELYIGCAERWGNTYYFLGGQMDDIRIYSKALIPGEVQMLYNENMCIETVYDSVTVYDTVLTEVFDTSYVTIHDTTYITLNDTILIEIFDTTIVTVFDSISVTDTLIIDVELTGINPPDNTNTIKVYPNPARTVVYIDNGDYNLMEGYTLKIVNMGGASVYEAQVDQQLLEIDVSSFGDYGVYVILIFDNTWQLVETRTIILE